MNRAALLAALAAALALLASAATADSFTPVRLNITIAPVARLHKPLAVTVAVSADPGVLDGSEGPMRIEVRLAGECGGDFQTTPGDVLLNQQLSPQPATGRAYTATASGSGRPGAYGVQTVCVYLEDADIGRVYANDESLQVDVSQPCTTAAGRYDAAEKTLKGNQRRLRRTHRAGVRKRLKRTVARNQRTAAQDRRRAAAACGSGVPL